MDKKLFDILGERRRAKNLRVKIALWSIIVEVSD